MCDMCRSDRGVGCSGEVRRSGAVMRLLEQQSLLQRDAHWAPLDVPALVTPLLHRINPHNPLLCWKLIVLAHKPYTLNPKS